MTQSAAANIYVYYRIDVEHRVRARHAVTAVLEEVASRTGIAGRVAQRRDDPDTWMETYEGVADAEQFTRVLDEVVARHAADRWLAQGGKRTLEVLVPLADCVQRQ